jgi:hypothetical protein
MAPVNATVSEITLAGQNENARGIAARPRVRCSVLRRGSPCRLGCAPSFKAAGRDIWPSADGLGRRPQIPHFCDGGHIPGGRILIVSTMMNGDGHENWHQRTDLPTDSGCHWLCGNRCGLRRGYCPFAGSTQRRGRHSERHLLEPAANATARHRGHQRANRYFLTAARSTTRAAKRRQHPTHTLGVRCPSSRWPCGRLRPAHVTLTTVPALMTKA